MVRVFWGGGSVLISGGLFKDHTMELLHTCEKHDFFFFFLDFSEYRKDIMRGVGLLPCT